MLRRVGQTCDREPFEGIVFGHRWFKIEERLQLTEVEDKMSIGNVAEKPLADSEAQVAGQDIYGSEYVEWKDWNAECFGLLSKHEEADISAKLKKGKVVLPAQSRVLEIGFGNGSFLAYGRKRQWEIHGTEVNMELVERARQRGFRVVHAENLKQFPTHHFNLVVAFDVLEHLAQEELIGLLREIKRVLENGGVFIARFPNGDSPFGNLYQHGDLTHKTTIGSWMVRYFAREVGMELVYLGGEPQSMSGGAVYFVHRMFAIPVKYFMNLFVNVVFFPRHNIAFTSPNLVAAFRAVKRGFPAGQSKS